MSEGNWMALTEAGTHQAMTGYIPWNNHGSGVHQFGLLFLMVIRWPFLAMLAHDYFRECAKPGLNIRRVAVLESSNAGHFGGESPVSIRGDPVRQERGAQAVTKQARQDAIQAL